jgi:hypothetical protein
MEPGFGRSARDAVHDPHAAVTPRAALPGQRTLQLLARHQALSGDALHHAAVPVAKGHVEVWSTAEEGLLAMSGLGVSKSKALASWCTRNGIGPEDVVAFGDMPNDVPMLTWAGTSYAVANAHPAAAAAARHGAPANDDDGVRRVLDELFR